MSDTPHSDAPSSHKSKKSRSVKASQLAQDRIAAIVGNSYLSSFAAPSIYTNPMQGSPGTYRYDERQETPSIIYDDSDENWLAGPPVPPLALHRSPRTAVALKNLRRFCALTHSAWKDEKDNVLPYHCVQEAHVVDKALSRQKVYVVLFIGLVYVLTSLSFIRKLNLK